MKHASHEVRAALLGKPHDRIDIEHSRVAYWQFGQGPDLFFVHGWPLHSATFRNLVPELSRSFTCHLIDLPGTGQTVSDRAAPIGLEEHATTVRRVVHRLGLGRLAYVAHDSGGAIARLAAAGDSRVAGVVLGNTELPAHRPWLISLYVALMHVPGSRALTRRLLRWRAYRRSALGFGGAFTDKRFIEGDFHELFIQPMIDSREVAEGQIRLLEHLDPTVIDRMAEVHARIAAPTLLVWGTDDPFFPLAGAKAMMGQFAGGAELAEIQGGKLYCHEDRAQEFLAHTAPFLERCFAKSHQAAKAVTAVA